MTVLKTGLTPSASGSAYLELESKSSPLPPPPFLPTLNQIPSPILPKRSSLKLSCTVHGPRPLPRSTPFTPQLQLTTRIKLAPFATYQQRKGYVPDTSERDLAAHLETALRGSLIGERWPKSGVDVIVTILETEHDHSSVGSNEPLAGVYGMMSILAGCITVASAAIADAGIDCVDLVTGGVAAAVVRRPPGYEGGGGGRVLRQVVLDPSLADYTGGGGDGEGGEEMASACVVGYLQARDEITEVWASGDFASSGGANSDKKRAAGDGGGGGDDDAEQEVPFEDVVDMAVEAATAARLVLLEELQESTELKITRSQRKLQPP